MSATGRFAGGGERDAPLQLEPQRLATVLDPKTTPDLEWPTERSYYVERKRNAVCQF